MNVIHSTEQYDFIPFQDENEEWSIVAVDKMTGARRVVERYDFQWRDHPFKVVFEGWPYKDPMIATFEKLLDDKKHYKLVDTAFVRIRGDFD